MESSAKASESKASQKSSKSSKSRARPSKEMTSSAAVTLGSKASAGTGTQAKAKRGRPGAHKAATSEGKATKRTEDEPAAEISAAANKELASSMAVGLSTQADASAGQPRAKTSAANKLRSSSGHSKPAASDANATAATVEELAADTSRHSSTAAKGRKSSRDASTAVATGGSNVAKGKGSDKRKAKSGAADSASQPYDEATPKRPEEKDPTPVPDHPDGGAAVPDAGAQVKGAGAPEAAGADILSSPMSPKDVEKASALGDISGREGNLRRERRRKADRRKSLLVPKGIAKVLRKTMRRHGDGDESESLSSKEELSLLLVAVLAVFFFCFLVGLLFYYFFTGPNLPIAVACISDECVKAKEYMDSLLNNDKKPCADFYGHVCDLWRNTTSSFHSGVAGRQLALLNASLFRTVKIKREEDRRYGVHVLRPVYRSCYHYMSEHVELKEALKEAHELLEIGELMDAASFFDVVRYLVRQVMQMGVYTLFRAMFVHESGRSSLFMSRGYTLQEKLGMPFDTGNARKRFEQILKLWLGRDNVGADLKLLVEVDAKVGAVFRSLPVKEERHALRSVVSGMVSGVSTEQWVLAFKSSHREITVLEPTDEIITEGTSVFKKAMQLVVKHGLRKAAFYLATNLEADMAFVLSMRETIAKSEAAKAMYCLGFTYKCLTLTWAFLAARHLAEPRSIGVLQDILGSIQEAVTENRDAFVWMEESNRNKTAQELSKLSVHVIAGRAFNVTNVDYNKPDVRLDEGDKFLKVLLAALKLHHSVMAAMPPTRAEMLISKLEFESVLSLVPSMEYIVVPTLYQHDPYLYNYQVPDYFNYGTMGSLLGAQLVETVGVGVKDERQSTWGHSTATKHEELLRCLTERRRHLGFPDFDPSSAGQQQTQMVTLSISARLAYSGLRRAFRKKSRTVKVFNDYWPEAMRVFFQRFCLLWCSGSQTGDPLTPREKCILPLYNMEEFSELYRCDANSTGGAVCPT